MTQETGETPWEGLADVAACEFGERCRELAASHPYGADYPPPLDVLIANLATELWDRYFSRSEIRAAFEGALETQANYAAGEARRGDRV